MAPFRNKGWPYFDKFNEIIPNATARGTHTFSPTNTAAPGPLEDDEAAAAANSSKSAEGDAMEVDKDGDGATLISITASKRKLSAITIGDDNDDTITFNFGHPPLSSTNTPTSSNLTSGLSKRGSIASSAAGCSRSRPKAASSCRSNAASSRQASNRSRGTKTSGKLSSEMMVYDMQGSINLLTSTVRNSMESDPVTKVHQEAVGLLQTRDDGLSPKQKVALFNLFMDKHAVAQTYIAIVDDGLRQMWLQELCASVESANNEDCA
jgi:hypothetical protein